MTYHTESELKHLKLFGFSLMNDHGRPLFWDKKTNQTYTLMAAINMADEREIMMLENEGGLTMPDEGDTEELVGVAVRTSTEFNLIAVTLFTPFQRYHSHGELDPGGSGYGIMVYRVPLSLFNDFMVKCTIQYDKDATQNTERARQVLG